MVENALRAIERNHAEENAKAWYAEIVNMLRGFEQGEHDELVILESVLSVQVRGDWHEPGRAWDGDKPVEFEILLTTGGPALRLIGRLDDHCQPYEAELQYQDWGTPWTRYPSPQAELVRFASYFYFGE